jgi:hypothetical protein
MMKFPIYGKIKNVPNHQPVTININKLGSINPYCGCWRNPAPVENDGLSWFIPLFIGFKPSKVVQDFATIHSMVETMVELKHH